ncbi:TetR/AcrR family transcriptional regulator C-terminal domain-containing protein [Pararhizobium sp. IMCC21322]|uniref:TetR/AcrR family transcriptional regulator C-terminal domain-containing protein n=1 Tax=Pararhizobium sp. IMCC21322 TaxID=3067903 RepID=UPI0027426DD2|nr:TetR/AcrR family transcriptional regulator C-terminal domain-containing protein [Pararhizobium sp. IMCC21322]
MIAKNGTLKDNLRAIARTIGETFTSPILSNLYLWAIAEANCFPEIGRTFYELGPQTGVKF